MNKKILKMLGAISIPVGALLLSACGPQENGTEQLTLSQASDNWLGIDGVLTEWGQCDDAWDNDGDGFVDMADEDCHEFGPVRDLSLFDFPEGHNFLPDPIAWDIPGGPGFDGSFRDPALFTRWFRFLTEPDGNTAGVTLLGFGVNPLTDVMPAPLLDEVPMGTANPANNNNISLRGLHAYFLDHEFLPDGAVAPIPAPPGDVNAPVFSPLDSYTRARGVLGGWPGLFYNAQGPHSHANGSQGALQPTEHGFHPFQPRF